MDKTEIVRAWKDEEYRSALGEGELAALPAHPAGVLEICDAQLCEAAGMYTTIEAMTTMMITPLFMTVVLPCFPYTDTQAQPPVDQG